MKLSQGSKNPVPSILAWPAAAMYLEIPNTREAEEGWCNDNYCAL